MAADLQALGYDAIPLKPDDRKRGYCASWPYLAPSVQWAKAPPDVGVGLRGGGDIGAVYCDCDDKNASTTSGNVTRLLAGWGYTPDGDYPTVRTVTGGMHIYARTLARFAGHCKTLRRELGAGELRYGPGSLVVAPGSTVNGYTYTLSHGDLRQLPVLDFGDLRLLADVELDTTTTTATAPSIPRGAWALLNGQHLERYASRSEAEQALVDSLVNAGHDFESILFLFVQHPCAGKFAELRQKSEKDARRWLRRSYDAALQWTRTHESTGRRIARLAQEHGLSISWTGKTGSTDRAVYLAHTEIARRAGAITYAAPVRRLAELAGVNKETVYAANKRLVDAGLVAYETAPVGNYAARYRLTEMHSPYTSSQGGREEVYGLRIFEDAFRRQGLGKAACEVWTRLQVQPGATAAELAELTGRHVTTIRRALARMERLIDPMTGEVLRLVKRDGEGWRAVDADLGAVARVVGTQGAGARQRAKHEEERRARARDFRGRGKDDETGSRDGARIGA